MDLQAGAEAVPGWKTFQVLASRPPKTCLHDPKGLVSDYNAHTVQAAEEIKFPEEFHTCRSPCCQNEHDAVGSRSLWPGNKAITQQLRDAALDRRDLLEHAQPLDVVEQLSSMLRRISYLLRCFRNRMCLRLCGLGLGSTDHIHVSRCSALQESALKMHVRGQTRNRQNLQPPSLDRTPTPRTLKAG